MKKILGFLLLFSLFLPQVAFANGAGLPAFFKINGKLSNPNPLQLYGITASTFLIPQDFTPENYVVNQPINFEIDETPLQTVIDPSLLKNTKYVWDFGDGSSKADGLTNTHTYAKSGSYILILIINIYDNQNQAPTQFVDSFLLNILPDKNFTNLPQAAIKVNGTLIKDPLNNRFAANLSKPMVFDASASKTPSKIVEYLWNFGDGSTGSNSSVKHTYTNPFVETVVLRIKDTNGFLSDAFVGINNDKSINGISQTSVSSKDSGIIEFIYSLVFVVILIGFSFFIKYIYNTRNKKK